MDTNPGRVWGAQHPFERNHLQRSMTLTGLGGVCAVAVILLVHGNVAGVLGISLICAGGLSMLAALSRSRYVDETRHGFGILRTRGGGFVLASALVFCLAGFLVTLLILLE